MKIIGIGVDVVETARIESMLAKYGDRFLNRVYTAAEVAYCVRRNSSAQSFAARFAAKEAVSKAFGTGIGESAGWREIEVCRRESGEPFVLLHGAAERFAQRAGITRVLLTLSHSQNYAVANAIAVGDAA